MGWVGWLDGWIHESVEDEDIMPKYSFSLLEGSSELIRGKVLNVPSIVEADSTQYGSNSRSGTKMAKEIMITVYAERWMVKTLHVMLWACPQFPETER